MPQGLGQPQSAAQSAAPLVQDSGPSVPCFRPGCPQSQDQKVSSNSGRSARAPSCADGWRLATSRLNWVCICVLQWYWPHTRNPASPGVPRAAQPLQAVLAGRASSPRRAGWQISAAAPSGLMLHRVISSARHSALRLRCEPDRHDSISHSLTPRLRLLRASCCPLYTTTTVLHTP